MASLVDELVKEGAVAGAMRGGGTQFMPDCYSSALRSAVAAFYSQNGWIGYDTVKR